MPCADRVPCAGRIACASRMACADGIACDDPCCKILMPCADTTASDDSVACADRMACADGMVFADPLICADRMALRRPHVHLAPCMAASCVLAAFGHLRAGCFVASLFCRSSPPEARWSAAHAPSPQSTPGRVRRRRSIRRPKPQSADAHVRPSVDGVARACASRLAARFVVVVGSQHARDTFRSMSGRTEIIAAAAHRLTYPLCAPCARSSQPARQRLALRSPHS